MAPDDPDSLAYQAAQAADTVRHDLVARGASFCMETVFSDPQGAKVAFLKHAREQHYVVILVFIGLETGELAIARVVERVDAGGHDVPDDKILSRFPRTLENLTEALSVSPRHRTSGLDIDGFKTTRLGCVCAKRRLRSFARAAEDVRGAP